VTADTRVAQALIAPCRPKRQIQLGEDDGIPGQPHQVGGCRLPESCETWGIGGPCSGGWQAGTPRACLPLTENKYELLKQEYELCLSIVLKQVLTSPEDLTSYDMLTLFAQSRVPKQEAPGGSSKSQLKTT
jgi:hypothetical protein